jgi:hypothetical protein
LLIKIISPKFKNSSCPRPGGKNPGLETHNFKNLKNIKKAAVAVRANIVMGKALTKVSLTIPQVRPAGFIYANHIYNF